MNPRKPEPVQASPLTAHAEPVKLPLVLDSVTDTRRTKKVQGEKVRVRHWAYKFKAADDGTTVTVRTDEERPWWREDEKMELLVTQRTYQTKLELHPPAKKPRKGRWA